MSYCRFYLSVYFFISHSIFLLFAIIVGCSEESSRGPKRADLPVASVSLASDTISIDSLNSLRFFKERLYSQDTSFVESFINNIDKDKRGRVFPIPLIQSTLFGYEIDNYLGLRYVLAITAYFSDEEFVDSLYSYYPFLFPVVNDQVIKDTLSRNDILTIKSMYHSWWSDNNAKDIMDIRDSFSIDSVLKGKYRFQWRPEPVSSYR